MKINFVAEVGVNHEGSLESAQNHIRQAAASGARAVKFQAYSASMLASENSPSYWDVAHESETSQFKLFSRYDKFTLDDYKVLAQTCEEQKVEFMVTAHCLWSKRRAAARFALKISKRCVIRRNRAYWPL